MLKALVVEDEKLEREAFTKLIRDKFHEQIEQVVAVSNGSQALQDCSTGKLSACIYGYQYSENDRLGVFKED